MKQTVRYTRTEIFEIELEVIQPLTLATLTGLVNNPGEVGAPQDGKVIEHRVSAFRVTKASPGCECARPSGGKKKR